MKEVDLSDFGAAPFSEEQNCNYWKFAGSKPEDLQITDELLALLPDMPEDKVRKRYREELPRLYQEAAAFFWNTGWPEVNLEKLFEGTICPKDCLLTGVEVLAKEALELIKNGAKRNSLVNPYYQALQECDDLLSLLGTIGGQDLSDIFLLLTTQMEQDLESYSTHLTEEDVAFLTEFANSLKNCRAESDGELKERVEQFYRTIQRRIWAAQLAKKNSDKKKKVEKEGTGEKNKVAENTKPASKEQSNVQGKGSKIKPRKVNLTSTVLNRRSDDNPSEAEMQGIAHVLWREEFFQKITPYLKEDIFLHLGVLAKALYFLSSGRRRLMVDSLEKTDEEMANIFEVGVSEIQTVRIQCYKLLAEKFLELRIFAEVFEGNGFPRLHLKPSKASAHCAQKKKTCKKKSAAGEKKTKVTAAKGQGAKRGRKPNPPQEIDLVLIAPQELPPSEDLSFLGKPNKPSRWRKNLRRYKVEQRMLARLDKARQGKMIRAKERAWLREIKAEQKKLGQLKLRAERQKEKIPLFLPPEIEVEKLAFEGRVKKRPNWLRILRLREARLVQNEKRVKKAKPSFKESDLVLLAPLELLPNEELSFSGNLEKPSKWRKVSRRYETRQRLIVQMAEARREKMARSRERARLKEIKASEKKENQLKRHAERLKRRAERIKIEIPGSLRLALEMLASNEELHFEGRVKKRPRWKVVLEIRAIKRAREERKKIRQIAAKNKKAIQGWPVAFLRQELDIRKMVSKEDWEAAMAKLSGYETDVIAYCFVRGKSFTDFSRKKYGTSSGASIAYKSAKRKITQCLKGGK